MLEDFEAVRKRISLAADVPLRLRIWADWQVKHPDWSPDELGAHLENLRSIPGMASAVDRAIQRQRASKPKAKAQGSQDGGQQQSPSCPTVGGWLMSAGCPDEWIVEDPEVPNGWACANGRLYKLNAAGIASLVAPAPVAVVGRAMDADTGSVAVDLVWRYAGRWVRQITPRRDALTRDGLLALTSEGLPVDQSTATDLARWMAATDAGLSGEPTPSLGRFGWLPDGSGFAPYSAHVTPPGAGEREEIARYCEGGTWDEWKGKVWNCSVLHPAEIVILASLAAPLLFIVKQDGWTLDIGGPRGSGKTTAQYAAASCWGTNVMVPWPRTWAGARSVVEFRTDVPSILDDTKNATSWEMVSTLLYQVAMPRSQVLGSAGGGTRAGRMLRTLVISTGESPIAEHLNDAQGAAFRALTLGSRPFPPGSRTLVQSIEEAARENYGFAGPRLVRWLVSNRNEWKGLRERHRAIAQRIAGGSKDDGLGRLANRLGLLYLAAELAERVLGLRSDGSAMRAFESHALGGAVDRDAPLEGLRFLLSYLAQRPDQVLGTVSSNHKPPYLAEARQGRMLVPTPEVARILEIGGWDAAELRRQWAERRWIATHKGRTDASLSFDKGKCRVVDILPEGITAAEA